MKRHISNFALGLIAVTSALALAGCADKQPATTTTPNTNANMPVAEATPDKAAIEAELTRIENDWPRIIKERDAATVRGFEADDAIFVYPDGSTGDKEQDVKDIESGANSADSWEITDVTVKVLDKDSAVVTLRNIVKGGKYKTPDGKSQDSSGEYRFVDVFARRNGKWQLVATCSVPVRNPTPAPSASPAPKAPMSMKPSPPAKASPAAKTNTPAPPAPVKNP
jgi:ketosteroid isomerase-like protein